MLPTKAVTQKSNTAGGHIAGGSIVDGVQIQNVENYIAPPQQCESALSRLYRKLKVEAEGDQTLTEYISQLQIFTRTVQNESVIGLDGKLAAANRQDELDMAMAMKEMIYGELRKNMFSRTFQTIYATLMGKIHEEFQTWIKPKILQGASREEIDQLVHMQIVKPLVAELEQCPEYDDAATATIRGMIYFLTGNCHLSWHS